MIEKIKYEEHNIPEVEIIDWNQTIELLNNGYEMTVIEVKDKTVVCKINIDGDIKTLEIPKKAVEIK